MQQPGSRRGMIQTLPQFLGALDSNHVGGCHSYCMRRDVTLEAALKVSRGPASFRPREVELGLPHAQRDLLVVPRELRIPCTRQAPATLCHCLRTTGHFANEECSKKASRKAVPGIVQYSDWDTVCTRPGQPCCNEGLQQRSRFCNNSPYGTFHSCLQHRFVAESVTDRGKAL